MEQVVISLAKNIVDPIDNTTVTGIWAIIDGITMSVPLDPANRHYAEIMRQVEAGKLTIQEAE